MNILDEQLEKLQQRNISRLNLENDILNKLRRDRHGDDVIAFGMTPDEHWWLGK